ncbi:hypothetical protein BU26DRAFT_570543 [Trematosphaeria pertusa]|uniref:Uncharacterized protein n=1 Tax=Trematosphaeria pertusa TaxID=390896 RepID=A0A6A6HZF0_9PLEO|nr:uncharacterized protein BU26DRAFT_570543 [Trematosphaeria pertusa]KAF2243148.1 hypothetical protein BU26DRAFT_570543 [Trematosphaeria pertusa]
MVDQNSNAPQPQSPNDATPSQAANQGMSAPSVVVAGQMMLIFALVLIFLVCLAVAVHLYLRRRRRRRKGKPKTKKKEMRKSATPQQPELQSQERKIAELVGTPLCEIGDSEPRHEMEDAEVHERYTTIDLQNPRDNPVLISPLDPDLESGTWPYDEMTTPSTAAPEAREYAVYWSRGL